ncbi:hypothetical protein Tco_1243764 [Tanacetum coccineum]
MGELLDSDVDSVIDDHDNTIPYHQYQLNNKVESVPTDVSSVVPGEISVITILDDLRSQLEGHIKTNEEQSFANGSLKAKLERYKTQVQNLEQSKVKKDLEQLVFERNKQNADLEEQLVSLKQQLLQHVESNKSLKTKSEKLKADKNALEESYLEELVWLRNTNKVITELLQSYGQPVQTVPMLSKRPTFFTKDLHKSALGHRIEDNLFKEVSEYMKIFDELDKEYDQCVIDKKSLEIENKNLLIQNECLLAESVSKDICYVVLTFDIAVPMSVEPRSNCVKEHSINLELEAKILKVCNDSSSPKLNVFFEINKLKDQLQGKDELLRKLKAQIDNMNEVSVNPNLSTLEFQALETENTHLKEELTAVRIKNASLRDENVSIKKRYKDLYQSKAESNSNVSIRAVVPKRPKVLAPGLYTMTPKYIPPRKRNNREANTPLPKKREVASTKPHHMIAPGSSRYRSNDMVHNNYLEEAKKQTHEIGRNSKTSVIPSVRSQSTPNGSKPKPRINNQKSKNWPASKTNYVTTKTVPIAEHSRNSRNFSDSKHFVCSTCQKCVFNANHDHCVTKFLNEVNSRAKVPSNKTTNRNKPVEQISVAKKPERQISKGHRFSIKKTSVVHEKTMTPRSCLRWKPTGKIFKTVGLRWVPTGKIFTSSTTKVDSE